MRFGRFAVLFSCCLLAACGGGGSGDSAPAGNGATPGSNPGADPGVELLTISLDWSNNAFTLFEQVRHPATASGFLGHTPNCTLLSGSLPAGMVLGSDCAISGRPTVPGNYIFDYRVGAAGVSNTVDLQSTVSVMAPSVSYQIFFSTQFVPVNGDLAYFPQADRWNTAADATAAWSYRVKGGSLPPGVVLEPDTGLIHGTVTSAGTFDVEIEATLTSAFGRYVAPATRMQWEASIKSFQYAMQNSGSQALALGSPLFKGEFFIAEPRTDLQSTVRDFRIVSGTLPAGLTFNAGTGLISGTPTAAQPVSDVVVEATVVSGITENVVRVTLPLEVRAFATIAYPDPSTGSTGVALRLLPQGRSLVDDGNVTWQLAPQSAACNLPAGVVLQPISGVIEGTPTTPGTYDCTVDFQLTHIFTTWVESARLHLVVN